MSYSQVPSYTKEDIRYGGAGFALACLGYMIYVIVRHNQKKSVYVGTGTPVDMGNEAIFVTTMVFLAIFIAMGGLAWMGSYSM